MKTETHLSQYDAIDQRIETLQQQLRQLRGAVTYTSKYARSVDNETLGDFSDLVVGNIDKISLMLCDISEDVDMALRGLPLKQRS